MFRVTLDETVVRLEAEKRSLARRNSTDSVSIQQSEETDDVKGANT